MKTIRKDKELDLLDLNARRNQELGLSAEYDPAGLSYTYGPGDDSPKSQRRTELDTLMSSSMLTRPTYPGNRTDEQKMVRSDCEI